MSKNYRVIDGLRVYDKPSPARSFAGSMNAPNTEIGSIENHGGYTPCVFLRADQNFMSQRIMERGIAVAPVEIMEKINASR